jgi:hypothetical protein
MTCSAPLRVAAPGRSEGLSPQPDRSLRVAVVVVGDAHGVDRWWSGVESKGVGTWPSAPTSKSSSRRLGVPLALRCFHYRAVVN